MIVKRRERRVPMLNVWKVTFEMPLITVYLLCAARNLEQWNNGDSKCATLPLVFPSSLIWVHGCCNRHNMDGNVTTACGQLCIWWVHVHMGHKVGWGCKHQTWGWCHMNVNVRVKSHSNNACEQSTRVNVSQWQKKWLGIMISCCAPGMHYDIDMRII